MNARTEDIELHDVLHVPQLYKNEVKLNNMGCKVINKEKQVIAAGDYIRCVYK